MSQLIDLNSSPISQDVFYDAIESQHPSEDDILSIRSSIGRGVTTEDDILSIGSSIGRGAEIYQ